MNTILKKTISPIYYGISDVKAVRDRADHAVWGSRYRHWCGSNPCPEFPNRLALFESVFTAESLGGPIEYLEFGVWEGESIRWWVGRNADPASRFSGFDSFEGLPEAWDEMPAGVFSTGGAIPKVDDPRCRFVKGLFHETLPGWLRSNELPGKLVINMDADLYGSTLFTLVHLLPLMKPGDILLFDEFHSYMHEFRAFMDALSACRLEFRALGRSGGWAQLALRVGKPS